MSAKIWRSLTDENQDLQKQFGCMNGIFQLLDRRHLLSARRINSQSHGQKKLPPGHNGKQAMQPVMQLDTPLERTPDKYRKFTEERVSTESAKKTSFSSSSCSSGFSPMEYNKTAQFEQSMVNQLMNKPNGPSQLGQRSPDIRHAVKDSIYAKAPALSVKTADKRGAAGSALVYIDSPRPLHPSQQVKPRTSSLDDSFRIAAKPRRGSRNYQGERDGLMCSSLKDAPRLSCDGRLSQDAGKSTMRLKELPRLSLDSRVVSSRGSNNERRSNFVGNSSKMLCEEQEPESSRRTSNIVAKLMGLEAFPQSTSSSESSSGVISSCHTGKSDPSSKSSRADGYKQNQIPGSPRNSHQGTNSARLKNAKSFVRPTAASGFQTEPTPWRQPDGGRGSQQTTFKNGEGTTKAPQSSLSVYGEMEKRLAELEFTKSGKDLRALKQILEAMQKTKEALNTEREQAPNLVAETSNSSSSHQTSNLASPRKLQSSDTISSTIKESYSSKGYRSPVATMKPVDLVRRTYDHASTKISTESTSGLCRQGDAAYGRKVDLQTAKDLIQRSNNLKDHISPFSCSTDKKTQLRTSKSPSALKVPGHIIREKNPSSLPVSPRLQQRNFRLQQQSPHIMLSSDSSKTTSQCTRQSIGSNSPRRKLRLKSPSLQQGNDQSSQSSGNMRDLSHLADTVSQQSESNTSLGSHVDAEVTSTNHSDKISTTFFHQYCHKQENLEGSCNEGSMIEPAIATLEQPSPVSVLDATFYRDESPSPVKKISNAFKDFEVPSPDEGEWNPADLVPLLKSSKLSLGAEIDDKKLEDIQHLVRNLQQINHATEEPDTNYIALLNKGTNSEKRYISDILVASGLLRDLDSGSITLQLQVSGYPINSKLFLELEKASVNAGFFNDKESQKRITKSGPAEKIQRLLIFDTVSEIVARKLRLEGSLQQWFSPDKVGRGKTRGQQLLEEVWAEVDQLQNNLNRSLDEEDDSLRILQADLTHRSLDWIDCHSEVSGVVLDVERLIFKDLITELINSEGAGQKGRTGGHCRKLLSM